MTFKATGNRVFIKKEEQMMKAGTLLLAAPLSKQVIGRVVAVGPGKYDESGKRVTPDVKVGDRVVYNQHGGQSIEINGEELTVFYDHDIYAILEEPHAT